MSKKPTAKQTEFAAEFLTERYFESEKIADEINEIIRKHNPHPVTVVFAALVLNRLYESSTPNWKEAKAVTIETFELMDKEGFFPEHI